MAIDTKTDIAVIGAGIAGLTAAIEAAGAGAKVTLFDARTSIGGRARTTTKAGFHLNEGPHALYEGGQAMAFLKELVREPPGGTPDVGGGVGIDGPVTGTFPSGLLSLLRTPLLRGDRLGMLKLFATLGRIDPTDHSDKTVAEAMTSLLGAGVGARFGHALMRLASYSNDPDSASADIGLGQLKLALSSGVRYLDNGWQSIVDELQAEAENRGVIIRPGTKVTAVRRSGPPGRPLVDLDIDERTIRYGAVIIASGGPHHANKLLGETASGLARAAATARPATVACLDVGLEQPWGPHPTFALGIDRPLYLSVHAPVAKLAPAGQTLVHVMRYHNPSESPDPAQDRQWCEAMLDQVRPGWRNDAAHIGFSSHLVAAHDQPSAAGGGMTSRHPVTVSEAPGVLVAGDWVGAVGALVDASVASGRLAGRTAAGIATNDGRSSTRPHTAVRS